MQWHFLLLQGTTCSFSLAAHQILLRGQTLRPRNMPKKCHFKNFHILLRLHTDDNDTIDLIDFKAHEMTFVIKQSQHEISNNVVCATSKASDQPAHTRSLIRALASRLNIL